MTEQRFRAYTTHDLDAVMERMARQLSMRLDAHPVVLVGVLRRGAPLAAQRCDAPDTNLRRQALAAARVVVGQAAKFIREHTQLAPAAALAPVKRPRKKAEPAARPPRKQAAPAQPQRPKKAPTPQPRRKSSARGRSASAARADS